MSVSVFYTHHGGLTTEASDPLAPTAKCILQYLDEGGANVVFRILPQFPDQGLPQHLEKKLLRIRKDLPHVQSARSQISALEEHFRPLFPPDILLRHELVKLGHGVTSLLNATLATLNRPPRRGKDLLPLHEPEGLLIGDMTAQPQRGETLLQLKPKWLAQSPNAPAGARRCRTCALRAKRASQQVRTATDAQHVCPLAFVSDVVEVRERAAARVTRQDKLQSYLAHDALPLLLILKASQTRLDPRGILHDGSRACGLDLCKAMTLRDCTLFVKISQGFVQAQLADLDLKRLEKLVGWREVEQSLVVEGWYTNTEDRTKWTEERVCVMSVAQRGC